MPKETELKVAVDGNNEVAIIESKGPLDLHASKVVVPWAAIDVIYHQILTHRIQRGQQNAAAVAKGIRQATEGDLAELDRQRKVVQ